MIFISRKKLLALMKEHNIAEGIKSGPIALFYLPPKKSSKKTVIARTINFSLYKKFVVAKYNNFFIPLHVYSLNEISK